MHYRVEFQVKLTEALYPINETRQSTDTNIYRYVFIFKQKESILPEFISSTHTRSVHTPRYLYAPRLITFVFIIYLIFPHFFFCICLIVGFVLSECVHLYVHVNHLFILNIAIFMLQINSLHGIEL